MVSQNTLHDIGMYNSKPSSLMCIEICYTNLAKNESIQHAQICNSLRMFKSSDLKSFGWETSYSLSVSDEIEQNHASLVISNVTDHQEGWYQCEIFQERLLGQSDHYHLPVAFHVMVDGELVQCICIKNLFQINKQN